MRVMLSVKACLQPLEANNPSGVTTFNWVLYNVEFLFLNYAAQMLRREARQFFLLLKAISVQCLGGISFLIVRRKDSPSNQKWVMHYFSGA